MNYIHPNGIYIAILQEVLVVLYSNMVCIIEGWSMVEVIQGNVSKLNEGESVLYKILIYSTYYIGIGWSVHDEDNLHLVYRKWNLKDQVKSKDVALMGW